MNLIRRLRTLIRPLSPVPPADEVSRSIAQRNLIEHYRLRLAAGRGLPSFADGAFRCMSQNGEDGILLVLLAAIGMGGRRAVELCVGDGLECNTANLVVHHGWHALMVDGDASLLARGRAYYAAHPNTYICPPKLVDGWVTSESVNALVSSNGVLGEIDLLSLDLDSIDYWIWKALDVVSPRVVVVEYQTGWGPTVAKTIPNDPAFRLLTNAKGETIYGAGASLGAFVKLGRAKGYRLVGCEPLGFNAFFLRDDVGVDHFPEVSAEVGFTHPHAVRCVSDGKEALGCYSWVDV